MSHTWLCIVIVAGFPRCVRVSFICSLVKIYRFAYLFSNYTHTARIQVPHTHTWSVICRKTKRREKTRESQHRWLWHNFCSLDFGLRPRMNHKLTSIFGWESFVSADRICVEPNDSASLNITANARNLPSMVFFFLHRIELRYTRIPKRAIGVF